MKSFRLFLLIFLFLSAQSSLLAQQIPVPATGQLKVRVQSSRKETLPYATVKVRSGSDSSFNETKVADSNGRVTFKAPLNKGLTVSASAVNHADAERSFFFNGKNDQLTLILENGSKTLQDVVLTSKKPLIRQEDDKTIIEPEALAAASTNGYEVIEKTPGLFVDPDGNIYISSLTPATVYINGREMKMSAADVASLLKTLPPQAIAKIEVLRTPSAKYDASGSGGIVNVVLKKGVKLGMTGSINTGIMQGTYGNKFASFTLNNNDGKKSSGFSISASKRNNYETIATNRQFAPDSVLKQTAGTHYTGPTWFSNYSLTRTYSKWDLDFGTSANLMQFDNTTSNNTVISKISTGNVLTKNLNTVDYSGYSFNYRIGLEAKKKIDTLGSEWDNDVFYNYTRNRGDQDFNTSFTLPVIPSTGGDGRNINNRDLFTLRSDLKLKMKDKFTFETGAKSSFLGYRSVAEYFRIASGFRTPDASRTNTFRYTENINALYVQGSKTFGKDLILKTGLRMENTNMTGHQLVPGDTTFRIRRSDLFPYVYLSKNIMKIMGFDLRGYLVYRRTISRPVYEQLNPFARFIDPYLSDRGNPSLRPQFTTNYEANISVDERPILAVGVNDTKDIFTNVIYQSDSSQAHAYRTYDNLGHNREWYFRALGAIPPGGKYFFVLGTQYNHNFYDGLYENKPLQFKKGSWTIFTYHMLRLGKLSQFTMNGFVRFRGQQQFYELSTFGMLNASINRMFLKQKLTVTLSANDLLRTNRNDFTISQGSVKADGSRWSDSRRFGINLRYNFGIRKKEENNPMNMDSPERVN